MPADSGASGTSATSVADRLRALPPDARAKAVARLAERGLLAAADFPPTRIEPPSDALTCKQRALWELDHDGSHGDFYHCGALWFADGWSAEQLAAAYADAAGGFGALGRVADGTGGEPRSRPVPPPRPAVVAVPKDTADPRRWVRAAVAAAARGPLDPARQPAVIRVYGLPHGASALAVLGHDLHLDQQGLTQLLGPAVAALLTGDEGGPPVTEQLRVGDFAAWQQERLAGGVLGAAVAGCREALRGTPPCPWPTGGDRTGRRTGVVAGPAAWEAVRNTAVAAGVSPAVVALGAWYRALVAWDERSAALPIGCCTTARVRPELATTLGNLTNTVIVVPGPRWPRLAAGELLGEAHGAMKTALGSVDVPFELVYGDGGPVQDEQIGVRFTFVEDAPAAHVGGVLQAEEIPFGYAKSVLSCEAHVTGDELRVWIDHRPAAVPAQAADRLAALLRRELAGCA